MIDGGIGPIGLRQAGSRQSINRVSAGLAPGQRPLAESSSSTA